VRVPRSYKTKHSSRRGCSRVQILETRREQKRKKRNSRSIEEPRSKIRASCPEECGVREKIKGNQIQGIYPRTGTASVLKQPPFASSDQGNWGNASGWAKLCTCSQDLEKNVETRRRVYLYGTMKGKRHGEPAIFRVRPRVRSAKNIPTALENAKKTRNEVVETNGEH